MDTVKDMRIDANKQGPPGYIEVLLNVENDHQIHEDIYKNKQGPPGYVAVFTVDNDWQIHEDIDKDKKGPPGRVAVLTVTERVRWLVPAK